ncbi:MAG: ATP-grasp domain-containing protein [Planctomycetes bacterium]|nr:ATP-grasp domain-containing protein [Planctomycetota bacterium]
MRVFVYEHMTATATGRAPGSPEHGMYREGRAMRDAHAADLRAAGADVTTYPDDAPPCDDHRFLLEVARSDRQLIIAPELHGTLHALTVLARTKGNPLGPSPDAVALTSDKLALAEHWRACGVPTPATTDREPTACDAAGGVIVKPRFGAGSTATYYLDCRQDFYRVRALLDAANDDVGPMILQDFVPGRAASVAFLCGPRGHLALPPAFQSLSADGRFKYEGGEVPIPPALAARATALATRAVACVPGLLGYVGVDLVLGETADGTGDRAIEINPRLTTSYLGLRALTTCNLAELMLRIATGDECAAPQWKPGRVYFGPDGQINRR